MKKILVSSTTVSRKWPKNLSKYDNYLFEDEKERKIGNSYIFYEKNVRYFNAVIISIWKLKYYKNYSFFGDKTTLQRVKRILKNFLLSKDNIETIEAGTWCTDNKSHVYFHWLFDALQRAELASKYLDEYPLLIPERYIENKFIIDTLDHLNFKYKILEENKIYKVKNLLITSKTALTGNYHPEILDRLVERFRVNASTEGVESYKNIFIYRKSSLGRSIVNFEEIETLLLEYEYKIIEFEQFSFSEKIALLENTKNLVGLFGSGLSNMIYLKAGSNVVELRRKHDNKNNAFYSLANSRNINYYYGFFNITNQGCLVDKEALRNILNIIK